MAKYIDVEPLINDGWQLQRYNSGDGYVNQEHASIKDIPPADVRPVKRGRWVYGIVRADIPIPLECSVCEWQVTRRTNFCPHCGADMRGGDAE